MTNEISGANRPSSEAVTVQYDDTITKYFTIATLVFGLVAFLVGLIIAVQLAWPAANMDLPWITFGRLRPLHTNAAIFAFAGNAIFAGVYYSTQRLLKTRMASDVLSRIHFWGWQLIIVAAAISLPLGFSHGKEYAELEWPIDIAIAVIWIVFGSNLIWTMRKRNVSHMYVSLWFYLATFITVALLHVVNSIELPVSWMKSYPVYAGVSDALVQWWYGHNAVAFFLTTPFLGLMYYFVPKAAGVPVFSYKLSIVHFWTLVCLYIWAGPHHLLNTALPEWAQTMGMVFSVMLWIPSWGGAINAFLTVKPAWERLKTDPVIKFLIAGTTLYAMATFEGPLLSIKSVSEVGHYTDWIIGHVHAGALGWNGFLAFGMIYYLVPRLWKTELYSKSAPHIHFWLGSLGIVVYVVSMWVAGITQGLMWRSVDANGALAYPDFVMTVVKLIPLYWVRAAGGLLYIAGYLVMLWNVLMTISRARADQQSETTEKVVPFQFDFSRFISNQPGHRILEGLPLTMVALALCGVLIGSVLELTPILFTQAYVQEGAEMKLKPYHPLELAGRDMYIREGCYTCHSQMIRTMVSDVLRFGPESKPEESMFDHPFQWGSKRTGPDLARVGGKYNHIWHFQHMKKPKLIVEQSIMPNYPWLYTSKTDFAVIAKKVSAMKTLGVPYQDFEVQDAEALARGQAAQIAEELRAQGATDVDADSEIIALIAYLQRLGRMGED